uniref:Si:ch73-244f7.3 n=1 Tax=Salarias fasciatus TaxID=181472 RepID=A0A672GXP6_SALFA
MGVSCRMLSLYNVAVKGLQMQPDCDLPTEEEDTVQKQQKPSWAPCFFHYAGKEIYSYVGQRIVIEEAFDSYAGMIWPAALSLCHYLDTHREQLNLVDKSVLEIGAGTGLVSIVAALLGGWVTATDLPEVLGNLRANLFRNTRGRCRYTPQVAALSWGYDLEDTYPSSVYRYDYVLAADVVYHHDYLDELLATMKHFCKPGTTLIWANKVRFGTDLSFTDNFKKAFKTSLLVEDGELKIFMATSRGEEEEEDGTECGIPVPLTGEEGKEEDAEDEKNKEELVQQEHSETEMDVSQDRGKEEEPEGEESLQHGGEEELKQAVGVKNASDIKGDPEDSASSDENMAGETSVMRKYTLYLCISTNLFNFS